MTDLTDDQYRILDRFVRGQEIGPIADAMGLPWLDVRNTINNLASGNRTKARALVNQRTPPERPESPLTAPIATPKPKPKEAPAKAPETATAAPAVAPLNLPGVPIDDLDTMDGVLAAGREHALHTIRTATAKAASMLADVRNQIIADRQEAAVKARIAELEAELAALRELVPT